MLASMKVMASALAMAWVKVMVSELALQLELALMKVMALELALVTVMVSVLDSDSELVSESVWEWVLVLVLQSALAWARVKLRLEPHWIAFLERGRRPVRSPEPKLLHYPFGPLPVPLIHLFANGRSRRRVHDCYCQRHERLVAPPSLRSFGSTQV